LRRKKVRGAKLHNLLEKVACQYLKEVKDCVETEVEFAVNLGGKRFIIDVVGFQRDGKKIAVECGECELSKLNKLPEEFDEVIIFRPEDAIEYLMKKCRKLRDYERIKKKYDDLLKTASYLEKIRPLVMAVTEPSERDKAEMERIAKLMSLIKSTQAVR